MSDTRSGSGSDPAYVPFSSMARRRKRVGAAIAGVNDVFFTKEQAEVEVDPQACELSEVGIVDVTTEATTAIAGEGPRPHNE